MAAAVGCGWGRRRDGAVVEGAAVGSVAEGGQAGAGGGGGGAVVRTSRDEAAAAASSEPPIPLRARPVNYFRQFPSMFSTWFGLFTMEAGGKRCGC